MYTEAISTSPHKIAARAEGIRIYREFSGHFSLPEDRQMWSLCSRQTKAADSEINQMVAADLIRPEQFHGVDRDANLIADNCLDHPRARWYAGEWCDVIMEASWNPGLVYLDTTALAGKIALNMAATTLRLCPANTVVLLNVMQTSPYSGKPGLEDDGFLSALGKRVPDLPDWCPSSGIQQFEYVANRTKMRTYAFGRAK
jgi:hypothetical protein